MGGGGGGGEGGGGGGGVGAFIPVFLWKPITHDFPGRAPVINLFCRSKGSYCLLKGDPY